MRVLRWFKANIWAAVIVLALAGSFYATHNDAVERDHATRVNLVTGCQRSTERAVLNAAFKERAADVRREAGDIKIAAEYQEFALGELLQLPLPFNKVPASMNISQALISAVAVAHDARGDRFYALRPVARSFIKEGCEEAFG